MRFAVVIVPGLRDQVDAHWQTLLSARLRASVVSDLVVDVPPMGRVNLSCAARVDAIEYAVRAIAGPVIAVAHSGGCIALARWAMQSQRVLHGALLATPPDFAVPMPEGYPTLSALQEAGWFPLPESMLPFPSIVAASRDDPLASYQRAAEMARAWGSELVDAGTVGHLNPASGYGEWLQAETLIARLRINPAATTAAHH